MRHLLEQLTGALIAYGPWGVFLLSVIDSVGVPLPVAIDAAIIGVAAANAKNPANAYFTALLAVVGSVGGNIFLFLAARRGGRLLHRSETVPGKRQKLREWFQRYGLLTVFIPAVVPVLPLPLKLFVITAGVMRTSLLRFAAVVLVARVIRCFGEVWLGLQLGLDAQGFLIRNGWTLTGVALAMAVLLFLFMRYTDRRGQVVL